MKKLTQIFGTVMAFLTNRKVVNIGCVIAALIIFIFFKKTFIMGLAVGVNATVFVMTNVFVREWAVKQYQDLLSKF